MTTLEEKLNQRSPERRAKIQARADQIMAEDTVVERSSSGS